MRVRVIGSLALLFALLPCAAFAQARSYHYALISDDITIERNASIAIDETQTYVFDGVYHTGFRSIPHRSLSAITDVTVRDASGQIYTYSSSRLDKNDPKSWGKYDVYDKDGNTNIEWYFDPGNATSTYERTWIISYVVHGAVSFYSDHDELYWNLFTDYDVPVDVAEARIRVPAPIEHPEITIYSTTDHPHVKDMPDDRTYHFLVRDVAPGEAVTFAAAWQKGLVSESAFWLDWLILDIGYVLSLFLLVAALVIAFLHWYVTEVYHKGRRTIIPEYDPPRDLPPAMIQLIDRERLSDATWPATIVDLAVRGYVRVAEEVKKRGGGFFALSPKKGYRVERLKAYGDDPALLPYEKEFLSILFEDRPDHFSTIEFKERMQSSMTASTAYQKRMRALKKTLFRDTDALGVYEIPLSVESKGLGSIFAGDAVGPVLIRIFSYLALGAFVFVSALPPGTLQMTTLVITALVSAGILIRYIVYNPRLNTEGFLLRDDCRGFKLYLKTAEQYRLQHLTSDLFEKFLPYAMIFRIEDSWARAFEGMEVPPPQWYAGGAYASIGQPGASTGGAFSATDFSASFGSSFSSAFASAGAGGGASGGGGGAGGGGGGGGGGAA